MSVTKHDQTLILAHMYDTSRYTATHTHTGGGGGGGGYYTINYMQIWRDEFLRLAWKKILSDEYHTVTSSTVSGPYMYVYIYIILFVVEALCL